MKKLLTAAILAVAVLVVGGCASTGGTGTIKEDGFSRTAAVVKLPAIPGVLASANNSVLWSTLEYQQILALDVSCQKQLFDQLPGAMQSIVNESGWNALAVAVGEGLFASVFPSANVGHFVAGGAGLGAALGANAGRSRQESAIQMAQADCLVGVVNKAQQKYRALEDVIVVPWRGHGQTKFPPIQ